MKFDALPLPGAFLIRPDSRDDERGSFDRVFCMHEFAAQGLESRFVQANLSTNARAGTVRGLHYQREPHAEVKLVRCIRGSIYDVIVDLRRVLPLTASFLAWSLAEANSPALYVPAGFAHGYQALTDGAAVFYLVSAFYAPDYEDGIHHADPSLGIEWPLPITAVSSKDLQLRLLKKKRVRKPKFDC